MPRGIYIRGEASKHANCRGSSKELFWKRVDKNGPIHPTCGQCWIWTAGKFADGYGQYKGKKSHRVSYEFSIGFIPKDLLVLHKCDRPSCVNPAHLFLGSQLTNMQDKMAKGRQGNSGTKSPCFGKSNGNYKHGKRCKK